MKRTKIAFVIFLLVSFSACAAANRAQGVKSTFLDGLDVSKQLENMPFDHSWVWTEVDPVQYKAVYVKPVRVDLLEPDAYKASMSAFLVSKESYEEKALEIAAYFHDQMIEKLKDYQNPRFTVANQPGPGVFDVEIALTELEFSHPTVHAGAIAAPLPGAAQALSTVSDPHAAFALRVSDSENGNLIATAADRKFPPVRIIDFNKVTISSSIRELCQNWSKEIADALNKGRLSKVERRGVVKLLFW